MYIVLLTYEQQNVKQKLQLHCYSSDDCWIIDAWLFFFFQIDMPVFDFNVVFDQIVDPVDK